jgi:Asp-tRNA(Asn)/Glu-tRNA(Gln) amidotransferase A subunit family amidase
VRNIFVISQLPAKINPAMDTKNHLAILLYSVQVVAAPFQDRMSLAVAEEIEAAFGGWVEPPTSEKVA